jgi:hypothetical protein
MITRNRLAGEPKQEMSMSTTPNAIATGINFISQQSWQTPVHVLWKES